MTTGYGNDDAGCLSAGTVMALLDGELSSQERGAALAHLRSCEQCRALSDELAGTAELAAVHLSCLDDERVATYVDHRAGRRRPGLSKAEAAGIHQHLRECERCRERVALLTRACRIQPSVIERVRDFLRAGAVAPQQVRGPALRWAPAVVAAAAAAFVFLVVLAKPRMQHQPGFAPPGQERVAALPRALPPPVARPGRPRGGQQTRQAPSAGPHEEAPSEAKTTAPVLPPETALIQTDQGAESEIRRFSAALRQAEKRRDAAAEATAAMGLARLYHRKRDYAEAARYYRQASRAAELAGEPDLRADSLIFLGAALAQMGQTELARSELQLALEVARKAGYPKGEHNARLQLRLLEGPRAGEGG